MIPVDPAFRPEAACLTGCGVATGWGSSVYAGGVRPGDASRSSAAAASARPPCRARGWPGRGRIFAIDPVPFKRDKALDVRRDARGGDVTAAFDLIREVTWGRMCDVVVLTMGTGRRDMMDDILALAAKRGRVVVTNIYPVDARRRPALPPERAGPVGEADRRLHLRRRSTPAPTSPGCSACTGTACSTSTGWSPRTYPLEDINDGYQDMRDGKNIRGVLVM